MDPDAVRNYAEYSRISHKITDESARAGIIPAFALGNPPAFPQVSLFGVL